jgi:dTDP-4-amino-4,6-dideoxygalactose transaminase
MTTGKGIPFVDLAAPHQELEEELMDAIRGVVRSSTFIGGPVLEQFEREFADFCGVDHCVGVSSGTDALRFALMAAGIGKGDIVVTVANTFVATVEAILQAGAIPQFVDVNPYTFNMSVDALREYLKGQSPRAARVKAILPVHLYGQIGDMDSIMALAEEYGAIVLEDACQAHGAEYLSSRTGRWQKAGSLSQAAAFSFYPGKNLGACGEAGAVTTNNRQLADRVRMIRDHGQNKKYHHVVEGYNGRLDAIQAAILRVKLPLLNDWNARRRQAAEIYKELLQDAAAIQLPYEPDSSRSVFHLYVVRTKVRDEIQNHLAEHGIATGLHYPVPVHLQEGYAHLGYRAGNLPNTEALAGEILSLPMYPQMSRSQQEYIARMVLNFSKRELVTTIPRA